MKIFLLLLITSSFLFSHVTGIKIPLHPDPGNYKKKIENHYEKGLKGEYLKEQRFFGEAGVLKTFQAFTGDGVVFMKMEYDLKRRVTNRYNLNLFNESVNTEEFFFGPLGQTNYRIWKDKKLIKSTWGKQEITTNQQGREMLIKSWLCRQEGKLRMEELSNVTLVIRDGGGKIMRIGTGRKNPGEKIIIYQYSDAGILQSISESYPARGTLRVQELNITGYTNKTLTVYASKKSNLTVYNEQGRIVYSSTLNADGNRLYEKKRMLNRNGLEVRSQFFQSGKLREDTKTKRNKRGDVVSRVSKDGSGRVSKKEEIKYDKQGRVVSELLLDYPRGAPSVFTNYFRTRRYNEHGLLSFYREAGRRDLPAKEYEIIYDSLKRISELYSYEIYDGKKNLKIRIKNIYTD